MKWIVTGGTAILLAMVGYFWNVVREIAGRPKPVYSQKIEYSSNCLVSPEGDEASTMRDNLGIIISHDHGPRLQSWRLPPGTSPTPIREIQGAHFLSYSADGQLMAIGRRSKGIDGRSEICVIDRRTGAERFVFPFFNDRFENATFSPNNRCLALDEGSRFPVDIRLLKLADGSHTRISTGWSYASLHFLADHDRFLIARPNGSWEKWSIAERRQTSTASAPEDKFECSALSSDCKLLAIQMESGRIYVWDVDREMLLARFPAFPAKKESYDPMALCFSDDNTLLIGSSKSTGRRFDPRFDFFRQELYGVYNATEFKVWNVADWNCDQTWLAVDHDCVQIRSIPRTRQFLSLNRESLHIWNLPPTGSDQ